MLSTTFSCPILMKLEFSRLNFEIYANMKFHELRSVEAELFSANRQTDRQTDRKTDRQTDSEIEGET
jgi:hypothetical protein